MNIIFPRIAITYKIIVVITFRDIGRIIYVQYRSNEKTKVIENAFKEEISPAMRGDILAADGSPLATSIPYY